MTESLPLSFHLRSGVAALFIARMNGNKNFETISKPEFAGPARTGAVKTEQARVPSRRPLPTPIACRNLTPADRSRPRPPRWAVVSARNAIIKPRRTVESAHHESSERRRAMIALTVVFLAASLMLVAKLFPQEAVADCVIHLVRQVKGF
jgi:hypothetical protein